MCFFAATIFAKICLDNCTESAMLPNLCGDQRRSRPAHGVQRCTRSAAHIDQDQRADILSSEKAIGHRQPIGCRKCLPQSSPLERQQGQHCDGNGSEVEGVSG